MRTLAHEGKGKLLPANVRNREPDRIPIAAVGKMRACRGVAKIAKIADMIIGGTRFAAGGTAVASPSGTQRQTRRMRPRAIADNFKRHKKWASQAVPSEISHCIAARSVNAVI